MPRRTGYVFHELYMWHDAGTIAWHENVQPGETWENPDTKKRLHSLLAVSGILDKLTPIAARPVLQEELEWFPDDANTTMIQSNLLLSFQVSHEKIYRAYPIP